MKRILITLFLVLSFSHLSLGYGSLCHQSHTTLRLNAKPGIEQILHRNGYRFHLTRLDSSHQNTAAYQRAEQYLNVDFMASLNRLKKSEEFYQNIQRNNYELLRNSYVLLVYGPGNPDIPIGGTVFVIAREPGELLLLEKELNVNFFENTLKPEFPIAEVARVSVNVDLAPPGTFQHFVSMIMEVMRATPEIKHFYAYTSVAHQRFYQGMGVKTKTHADQARLSQLEAEDLIIEPLR